MTRMLRKLILIVSLAGIGQAHALDIKGIRVDAPADCAAIRALEVRQGNFFQSCESGRETWMHRISFLSGQSTLFVRQSIDKVVLSLSVTEFDFHEALDALTIKYGKPTIENSVIQNRMGASFEQTKAHWVQGQLVLSLSKHGSKIDSPMLMLTGEQAVKESQLRRQERATKGAGNI